MADAHPGMNSLATNFTFSHFRAPPLASHKSALLNALKHFIRKDGAWQGFFDNFFTIIVTANMIVVDMSSIWVEVEAEW